MTTHTPQPTAFSMMCTAPTATARVFLVDAGAYPGQSSFLNQSWHFNGTDWIDNSAGQAFDPNGPLPTRLDAVMAYDGTNVMLYGGRGPSETAGVLEDTWSWNGTAWSKLAPATVPYGRFKAEAATLGGTGALMFGGALSNGQLLLETWTWNATTWAQVTVANGAGPAARIGHAMSGNAAGTGTVVLFGGQGTNSQFNDTWTYTTAGGWVQVFPATSPSVRSNAVMTYDATNSLWVMFGGENEYNFLPETWTFNGTTWTQQVFANGVGPAGLVGAQFAYDATSGKNILFGGLTATQSDSASSQTWAFDGSAFTWTQL